MSKSMKKSLIKALLVLTFVAVGYFYTDHFDSSSQDIKNGATTNVKQTINVDGDNLKIPGLTRICSEVFLDIILSFPASII